MSVAERIACFEFIKNIPYEIGLPYGAPGYCCSSKSKMLARLLEAMGLETRQIICGFDWTETPLPQDLLALPREAGETHQFMQVFIPEKQEWVDCDPTWDQGLQKAGFDIAEWDGLNDTILAVKPHRIYTPEEVQQLMIEYSDPDTIRLHFERCDKFYRGLNKWMKDIRHQDY